MANTRCRPTRPELNPGSEPRSPRSILGTSPGWDAVVHRRVTSSDISAVPIAIPLGEDRQNGALRKQRKSNA